MYLTSKSIILPPSIAKPNLSYFPSQMLDKTIESLCGLRTGQNGMNIFMLGGVNCKLKWTNYYSESVIQGETKSPSFFVRGLFV